ncbi:MAG: hypothetical protein K6T83_22825 [Alicyclobacillus sp.]|nr:hypothetical protein [Alicyclobacillus sp.]
MRKWLAALLAALAICSPTTAFAAIRVFRSGRSGGFFSSRGTGGSGFFSHAGTGATHYGSYYGAHVPHIGIGSHILSFGLGYLLGGMFHPFGGYYGYGGGYMYHPFSLIHVIIDLVLLWVIFRLVRRLFFR